MTTEAAARANRALNRVRDLLHRVHEAARDFEAGMPPRRFEHAELLTDCIHRLRQSVESLASQVEPARQDRR